MDRIGWSLRMADFFAGVAPTDISGAPGVTGTGNCNAAWVLDVTDGIFGYDGGSAFPLTGCVNNANYVKGTDILIVRYADTDTVASAGTSGTANLTPDKIYLQAQTGTRGILFANTRPSDLPNSTAGVSTYPYAVEMYYVRPCSDPGAGGVCGASSDGGNPIPTLMRLRLQDDGTLISEPVVEGVEQLQFEYGIRNKSDPSSIVPQYYEDATAATSNADWPYVVAVRVGYVLRAQTRDTRVPHTFDSNSTVATDASFPARLSSDCQYKVDAAGAVTITSGTCANFSTASVGTTLNPAQQFARNEMTAVVQVRNRVRNLGAGGMP